MVTLTGGSGGGTPIGSITAFAGAIADIPIGFLHCDGSTINRNDFNALWLAIGIAWGYGDQVLTFEIPDLQGRFMRGQNNGSGNDPNAGARTFIAAGANIGDNVGSLQADEFKYHTHIQFLNNSNFGFVYPNSVNSGGGGNNPTGGAGGSETRPKNVNVVYIIKY